ncbi:BspA family leucine-rich repeat surface protein [Lactobacillus sp. ESL0679]|uniref:BspA family leucine-rich repeat surface protein n=1 Tax=Lactobacillus sp. ESL0679 TaxID=2983209 RepID=UPI0023F6B2B6|nr:BspA family leucine-rich repeat surface protein [Lactobacillus sp. ESL0679]MDF7683703.1 BspA family leucine-rich repeat surface protein [Lactobacillus sp. ESL0679]
MHFNNRKKLVKAFLKNNKTASRNLLVGAAIIAGTVGGLTTVNQAHAATVASTQTSVKKAKSSVQVAKLTKKTYLYNKSGKRVGKKALKKNKTIKIYGTKTIKGKTYYSLGHGKYVLASRVKFAKSAEITKKSYLYNKKGKRISKKAFKAGKTVQTYGTKTIKGKTYYSLGSGKYILAKNVMFNDSTSAPSPANGTNSSKPSGNTAGSDSSTSTGSSTGSNTSNNNGSTSSDIKKGVSGQCDLTYDPSTKTLHIAAGKDGNILSNDDTIATSVSNMKVNSDDIKTISIDSKVSFPADASQLFEGLKNITEINGLNKVDTSNTTDMSYMFGGDISLQSLDLSNFNTSKVINMESMFDMVDSDNGADYDNRTITGSLTSLDLSNFDTGKVTDMSYMFNGDNRLTSLDLSNFDTSKVTDMSSMFANDKGLKSLNISNFNTGKVTDMSFMFFLDESLASLDVSNFNTANVTNMSYMFEKNELLTSLDVSNFNTSKVTNMAVMFGYDPNLKDLDLNKFDTANVVNMSRMFTADDSLTSLDLSSFNTSKVTDMSGMFNMEGPTNFVPALTSLDLSNFDTSNVTDMHQMFAFNKNLTTLNISSFNTSKVTSMASMFHDDINLRNLDVNNFDTHNVKSMIAMFHKVPGPISGIDHFDFSSINDGLNGNASNHYNMFNTVIAND